MKVRTNGRLAAVDIETYEDLLAIRAMPDYRWTGDQTIECDAADLELIGYAAEKITDTPDLAPHLFDYQAWIVERALDRERFAIFADTGLGKTAMQLEWARVATERHGGRTLIVAPLSVCRQTIAEADHFYGGALPIADLTSRADLTAWVAEGSGIGITNYEKFDGATKDLDNPDMGSLKYAQGDQWDVQAVVLDECFAAGTLVDTPEGPKAIEHFKIGDRVISAAGEDVVWDVHRREVPYAIAVHYAGQEVICSPNHPWLTQRGWVGAQDLEPGDSLVATTEAVRMVREPVPEAHTSGARARQVLRHVLLSEMEDERPRPGSSPSHPGGGSQTRSGPEALVGVGSSQRRSGTGTVPQPAADERPSYPGEGLPPIERNRPRTFRAWGEWAGPDGTTIDPEGVAWRGLGDRVLCVSGSTDTRLSHALQARLGQRRAASRYRGGWDVASQPPPSGREEGREAFGPRVESLEVLESGDPRLARFRDATGALCFYDLGVVGHPSFSVGGVLVHNSSMLKSFGSRKFAVVRAFDGCRYKLACSATPAPNQRTEFAQHALFLGQVRSTTEYLTAYFVNRDGDWEFKPHSFEAWVSNLASWAVFVRSPKAWGFHDHLADLQPLTEQFPPVALTDDQVTAARRFEIGDQPSLFGATPGGITSRTKMMQIAHGFELDQGKVAARYEALKPSYVAELCEAHAPEQVIVWVTFDEEGDQLADLIDDSVHLSGRTKPTDRDATIDAFRRGEGPRVLILKPAMFGFGVNLQACSVQVFSTITDCYDEATEVLTRDGWRSFVDVTTDVELATCTPDGMRFEWQRPSRIVWEPYIGPMVRIAQERSVDLLVTPNHRVLRRRSPSRFPNADHAWSETTAAELVDDYRRQKWEIPCAAAGFNGSTQQHVTIPRVNTERHWRRNWIDSIPVDDFAELAGWYLTEGHCRPLDSPEAGRIVICQTDHNPEHRSAIIDLLKRIGFESVNHRTKDITVYSLQLASFLVGTFGHLSANKFIPAWVKDLDSRPLRILYDTMMAGDGGRNYYKSASPQLLDDFQEVAFKVGVKAVRRPGHDYVSVSEQHPNVSLHVPPTVEHYSGMIGCASVPNGTLVVRRNGSAVVSGNSFERYYQCVRRSHRYGQTKAVQVYVPLTQLDEAICQNTMSKQATFVADARTLEEAVVARLRPRDTSEVKVTDTTPAVEIDRTEGETWTLIHGDSIAHLPTMSEASVDLCVFSPPFAALYAYSKALGDMGNVRADTEFRLQWRWFAERLLPVMAPGRIVAIHCKEIIRFANTHGYRHCYDFPSDLRQGMVDAGFRYQRRITIWKNPQLEATRNKETSLLHVTALRDASDSFPQTGEYLMVFTAPGDNAVPVTHERDEHSFERHTEWMNTIWEEPGEVTDDEAEMWRQWIHADGAGSVWTGIRETDVLTAATAKDHPDEKHVCPLQLGLIERAVRLWTNPGELVLSPFAGIGSEGWAALGAGRRFYGIELKDGYYATAARNLARREAEQRDVMKLFAS